MGNSLRTTSIHILDDDSLLHIFYLYRPFLLGEDEDDNARLWGGNRRWARGRWWYRPAQVCRRWRNVIFGAASYLDLSLVCTYRTPVAGMLANSPPLPLVVDYLEERRDITTDDEEGIILALRQRGRVLRVRLNTPVTSLQKVIATMDGEYPILEHLVIWLSNEDKSTILIFPEMFQAPHLRCLRPRGFSLPIESRLLTTAVGLVTLSLVMAHPSTYFHPNTLLQWISLMPQLETLIIQFEFPTPNRDVERHLTHTPIIAPITLPNLRYFQFHGVSTYLESLVHWIATPRLERLNILFFYQSTFFVPHLLQFMNTAENIKFDSAAFRFSDNQVSLVVYPRGANTYALGILVGCSHLDWQVSSMAQISDSLCQMISSVEHLVLEHDLHNHSSEEHNQVNHTEWCQLLRPFRNVKTFGIGTGLAEELSHFLKSEDGGLSSALLPKLEELTYSASGDTRNRFISFIDTRQNTGRPVTLVRR